MRGGGVLFAQMIPFLISISVLGNDWTQYRGSNHDGTSLEIIRTNWTAQPPQVRWKVSLGPGLSSLTIQNGRVFTQVRRPWNGRDEEFCIALDSNTGQELWASPLGLADYPNGGVGNDDGPRSTPVVDGDRVFILSSYMRLACLSVTNGSELWSHDLVTEFGSRVIPWQNAASPVLEGELVLINANIPSQSIIGFSKADGHVVWRGNDPDWTTHASAVSATIEGVRQTIFFAQSGLVSVAPETGAVLWRFPLNYNGTSVAASPVIASNRVYCSRAYPGSLSRAYAGAVVVEIRNTAGQLQASQLWNKVNQLMNHWSTPVQNEGYIYGLYGQGNNLLKCIDIVTGDEKWSIPGFGYGSVLKVAGLILVQSETGHLVLLEPNPQAYTEVDRIQPLNGKTWNSPAISNGRIYSRSTTEAVCLDVSAPSSSGGPLRLSVLRSPASLQISLGRQDGSPLDQNQMERIGFETAINVDAAPVIWQPITNTPLVTNGQFQIEVPLDPANSQQIIRAKESP